MPQPQILIGLLQKLETPYKGHARFRGICACSLLRFWTHSTSRRFASKILIYP